MKKFLVLALLAAAVLPFVGGSAQAGKLFNKCHGCVTFCPAYYNAFSPPCLGIKAGCCVIPFPSFPAPPAAPCMEAPVGDCCENGACLGNLPPSGPAPEAGAPLPSVNEVPPAPLPLPQAPTSSKDNFQKMPQGPTQAAYRAPQVPGYGGHRLSVFPGQDAGGYNYGAYPGYNYGYGQSAAVPSYWYGGR